MQNRKLTFSKGAKDSSRNYYGIYRAKCLNNQDPKGLGRILAHIYETDGPLSYDEAGHQWIPVLSPYGGIPQMGFYMIPPIHADGYVIFEGGNQSEPVWIGTFPFAAIKEIDEEASQAAGYTVLRVKPTIPPELGGDPSTFVIKTQYPSLEQPDFTNSENIVENLMVMDESKLELVHINKNEYEYNSGGVSAGQPSSSISLTDNGIRLQVRNAEGEVHAIDITGEGIRMETALGDFINLANGNIQIKGSDQAQIQIEGLENGSIIINAKQVVLDGEQIIQGPPGSTGGGGAVTTDSVCPFVGLPIHIGSSKTIIGG